MASRSEGGGGKHQQDNEEEEEADRSVGAYIQLLRDHPQFTILWCGEIVSNLGGWFNYPSTLTLVQRLADGRGILLSFVLIVRYIPPFFLFPIAGVVSDRYPREKVLMVCCLVSSVAVSGLLFVRRAQDMWLLYTLLFIEFSAAAFYDPARRAMAPSLVPRNKLHLATTLDSFAWSLMGAIGASTGGLVASWLGVQACFAIDAVTYLVAAWCAWKLWGIVQRPSVGVIDKLTAKDSGIPAPSTGDIRAQLSGIALSASKLQQRGDRVVSEPAQMTAVVEEPAAGRRDADQGSQADDEENLEVAALLGGTAHGRKSDARQAFDVENGVSVAGVEEAPNGCVNLIVWSMRDELAALREGWRYVWSSSNRDVLALTLLKASGAIVWAAADVLMVRFADFPEMQSWGDAPFTLGLFFTAVGAACFVGPLIANYAVNPASQAQLLLASTSCFIFMIVGYLGTAVSQHVGQMMASIATRSVGSAVLWVYSTLLIQLRVPDELLGRTMALEMAFLTVADCSSGLFGGVALDDLDLSVRQIALIMAGVACVMTAIWVPYTLRVWRVSVRARSARQYSSVSVTDDL